MGLRETASSFSAPGRCGILGNPSDIYGGTVISCSIPARAQCRLRRSEDGSLPCDPRLWEAAVRRFPLPYPTAVEWTTEIPKSSGLSGSTALLAATLACVMTLSGRPPDLSGDEAKSAFAELLRDVERHDAGIMCGYQDAYMIVNGGLRLMRFKGKHPVEPGPPAEVRSLTTSELPFLLVTTGVERLSGSVHGPMSERWLAGESAVVHAMERIGRLAESGAADLEAGRYEELAAAMEENHRLVAGLGGSGPDIDRLIQACKRNGALAAKLAGAGMGGTVIALTREPEQLRLRLQSEGYTRFMRPEACAGLKEE